MVRMYEIAENMCIPRAEWQINNFCFFFQFDWNWNKYYFRIFSYQHKQQYLIVRFINFYLFSIAQCKRLRFGEDKQYVADSHDILGKGFSGTVFRAVNIKKNNRAVAVKTERVSGNRQNQKATLPLEIENYKRIGRHRKTWHRPFLHNILIQRNIYLFSFLVGIPEYYFTGTTSDGRYHVMVMQLLRSSLEDLQKKRTNSQFTPKTVFMIGIQLVINSMYFCCMINYTHWPFMRMHLCMSNVCLICMSHNS